MSAKKKSKTMYMHTLDGQPATFEPDGYNGAYLWFAGTGHHKRAAKLVASRRQIHREQQACIATAWRYWNSMAPEHRGERPSIKRYGYVLVETPS